VKDYFLQNSYGYSNHLKTEGLALWTKEKQHSFKNSCIPHIRLTCSLTQMEPTVNPEGGKI